MAKAKSGGTRSYLRGRIANDVYSIGKDAKGKKQQVVRSLAESVANPQTLAQMKGRMIMSTIMQTVSGLAVLVDHSFDNVPAGQPSISEFISQNYARLKADVAAHPDTGNSFALNEYQEKGAKPGRYIISDGKGSELYVAQASVSTGAKIQLFGFEESTTFGDLKAMWEVGVDGYLTLVFIGNTHKALFFRVRLASGIADDTVISSDNVATMFDIEDPLGTMTTATLRDGTLTIGNDYSISALGLIGTFKDTNGGFYHNRTIMQVKSNLGSPADTVLPTYPEGSQRFLNGGEL